VRLRVCGNFGLDEEMTVEKGRLSGLLQEMLPVKINSMKSGDELAIVGMTGGELSDLFTKHIMVEPRGELEVSETEEGGRTSIVIRIAGQDTLFAPGFEHGAKTHETTAGGTRKEDGGDWLREQIRDQAKDVAALAREMGESIRSNLNPGAPDVKRDVVPVPGESGSAGPEVVEEKPGGSVDLKGEADSDGQEAPQGQDPDMGEFINAYREEATAHVEKLKEILKLGESPNDKELIGEILLSVRELKNISTAMGLANISGLSGSLEKALAGCSEKGEVDPNKYGSIRKAVDKLVELHSDLENSDKAEIGEFIREL
jgi:hypothetical protein